MNNEQIINEIKQMITDRHYENLSDEEKAANAAWGKIPMIDKNLYENALEISNDGECPYCNEDVGLTEDIFPMEDCIGKSNLSIYETRFFRKCKHCGKVFYEDLGEAPDYDY